MRQILLLIVIALIGFWFSSKVSQKLVKIGKKYHAPGMQEVGLKPVFLVALAIVILVYLYSVYVK